MGGILKGALAGLAAVAAGFIGLTALVPRSLPAPAAGAGTGAPSIAALTDDAAPAPAAEGSTDAWLVRFAQALSGRSDAANAPGATNPLLPRAADDPDPVLLGPPGVGNRPSGPPPAPADAAGPVASLEPAAADPTPAAPPTPRLPQIAAPAPEAPVASLEPAAIPPTPAPGVIVGRLPQVTEGAPPPDASPPAEPAPAAAPPPEPRLPVARLAVSSRLPQVGGEGPAALPRADPQAPPAWARHRAAPPPADRPALGLVLLDTGADPAAEAALADFPVPLTLALDPFDPDAPRRAALYRAAGHEVALVLSGIAPGATAADVEVILAAWAQDFPQALALAELPPLGGRAARDLAPVLVPALQARGLALIAPDRGLSPLLGAARAQGVPVVGLYRALDAPDAEGLRRLLDRAGFEAERGGGAAVWGLAGSEGTRAALAAWLGSPRAGRVAPGAAGALLGGP